MPVFDGRMSRLHSAIPLWRIALRARLETWRRGAALSGATDLVQFVGFPRSGHSLVGSLLDAHPQAVVAHELDAMGLFAKGLAATRLPALMAWNAETFTAHGRWWNGYSYAVEGPRAGSVRVVGDKKGDWATRWTAHNPELIAKLASATPLRCRWILVTRHPLDNVATMSLRRGRAYDRLRIAPGPEGFSAALAKAQAEGEVPSAADDEMIDDYAALAAAAAQMKALIPGENWLEVSSEGLGTDATGELKRIASFLELDPDPVWLEKSAALVVPSRSRSRDKVTWTAEQRDVLARVAAAHTFLERYRDDV